MVLSEGALLGPYRIVGHLGAGGMGEVYRARDTRLERDVAVKVLPEHLSGNPTALKRFQREARALAALSHPNILTVYDIGEHEGIAFVVMELLQGETLRQRTRHSLPTFEEALETIATVAGALVAAHSQGIIHRDLKPENIFVTSDDRIKILDFGLAKEFFPPGRAPERETMTEVTGEGETLGTVPYMSPEQVRGENLDPSSDLFSTGTIFYELLTGRLPWQASNVAAIMHKILHEDPPPASTLRRGIPDWIDSILARALAKERENRYVSAGELARDLRTHLEGPRAEAGLRAFLLQIRKPRIVLPAIIVLIAIGLLVFRLLDRQSKIRWAKEEALPEIQRLVDENWRDFTDAYTLAEEAEKYIPDDPELAALFSKSSLRLNIRTEPPGAAVYFKEYKTPESEWKFLGATPVEKVRVPVGVFRWKMEKEGYETVLAVAATFDVDITKENLVVPSDIMRTLTARGGRPPGMVRVHGGETDGGRLEDFYIDQYEVTNRQFKEFVDGGGYAKREYWKHRFLEDGRTLTREEAIEKFVDQTGRPGPYTWQAGDYLEGQGDFPVSGISWYEAAAYAEFAGKSLPTVDHWELARGGDTTLIRYPQLGGFAIFAPFSNFGRRGPVKAGSLSGLTSYGAFDMAGNVREWCWNETPKGRLIRGGAWNDNIYMFDAETQAPPMDRSPMNGLRCALYPDPRKIPDSAFRTAAVVAVKDFLAEKPVPDAIFEVYKRQFSYDRTDLNARVESKDEGSRGWVHETITFDAAYGGEKIIAHLFLPRHTKPPYQTVIYLPGSASLAYGSSRDLERYYEFPVFLSFILKSGRAVLYPVYKGTFERREDRLSAVRPGADSRLYVEFMIQVVKDFRRCVDYLESREDIDAGRLAYYGMSWGGRLGAIVPAVEERLRASVLVSGGLRGDAPSEVDPVHYIGRVRIPTLMLNGRYDTLLPYEQSIKPMFDLLGTPQEHKALKLYESDHIPPRTEFIRETLAWLDLYLGEVQ